MRIFFYPECNFNINKASVYDCGSLTEWFDSQHKNPDDYEIVGKDGEYHDSDYDGEVCAVYPKIMGGKKKGKNILTAVIGLGLLLATGGTTAALFAHYGGINMAHALGAGLLLSGGGALLMGKMKMPSMDLTSDSATKENYQWNVGNLSTSRGIKGVTFGSNVIPEGELLAYRTYGTNSIEKVVRSSKEAGYYYGGDYNKGYLKKVNRDIAKYYKLLPGYTEYASVSTDSSSYLEMLIGCGEGELDSIADIKINDISVSDLEMVQDVDYAIRLGSNTQTALKQTNLDSQAGYQSIGQTVPVKLNGSVTPLLITTPSACDSCCIAFQVPNWYMYDTSSGAKNSAFIKLKIGYRTSGSSGSYTYLTKTGITEIDNATALKSDSAFYFQTVIKFPSNGTYQISIENDSAELNNTKGLLSASEYSGSALPDRAAINISVDNIACYNNKEQTYPNTALIWLRIPASQTLNGSMPKVTWKQTRASIYAYNGSSYVTKPADNLAWAIYDIIAQVRKDGNTYHNEGEDVNNIDFDKFVAFATFCESVGAKGNWFLNKLDTSWSNAMSVATSCRAFIGLRSGKVCPYWDAPTEMTQIFTVGNYEDMSGVITAKKDRAKAIEATFNNEEEKFASRTVRVEIDNDHSAEAVSMTFAGLSNPVNVSKQAHYILRRNKYLVQSVKFTADIDSIVCELNDVIGIQCDLTEYGVGGRIFKVENNVISLDAPVTLESGKTYALLVRHTDGTLERNTPVETNGTFTQLTFNSAWSKPVLKGDVYSFGIANSEVRKYRVTGITRTNDLKAQIEAIEYNENVYDELAVAPYTYTNPNAGINNVTTTYTPEAVELAWDANNNTSYVNVYVDGVFYGRYQNGAQIPNINSEQLIEMFPVNEYGEEDTPVVRTISNNLPTPSTPPVPIVQSTTTGCVAEFSGIPKDENIVWLIIKEGDNELGRANILGEYMSVSIQLRSGTHTLSAYFVNQFSKSSQARTFTATPLGDITANNISATALKLPTGSILRLSAKNCHGAEDTQNEYPNHISDVNGVKDVSGNGNHGQAGTGVSVSQDNEKGDVFEFAATNNGITIANKVPVNANSGITYSFYINSSNFNVSSNHPQYIRHFDATSGNSNGGFIIRIAASRYLILHFNGTTEAWRLDQGKSLSLNTWYHFAFSIDPTNGTKVFIDGELACTDSSKKIQYSGNTPLLINTSGTGRACKLCDIRIYPRALSASEIKTIYMFPDDVTFGQLTADLIGANIIKGTNLYSENIITQAAQINQAVFQSLIVTNGSTVANQVDVGGRNYYRNSDSWKSGEMATIGGRNTVTFQSDGTMKVVVASSGDDWIGNYNSGKLSNHSLIAAGATVTISIEIKSDSAKSNAKLQILVGSARKTTSAVTIGTTWTKLSWTGAWADTTNLFYYTNNLPAGNYWFGKIKLEIGNKATDWTPAPEDVDADSTAKANAVKNGLGTNGYTAIHGGNITTNTITANAIAANAITADKISVVTRPTNCAVWLTAQGASSYANGTTIPDLSGRGNAFSLYGTWNGINYSTSNGVSWQGTTDANRAIRSTTSISLPSTGWTIGLKFYKTGDASSGYNSLFDGWNGSDNKNRIYIRITSGGVIQLRSWNSSGSESSFNSNLSVNNNKWYNIFVVCFSDTTTIRIYLSEDNSANYSLQTFTVGTRGNLTCPANGLCFANYYGVTGGYIFRGYVGYIQIFSQAKNESEIQYLMRTMADSQAGQITADRIATDCLRSRDFTDTNADILAGKAFSTTGTFFNLAGIGSITSKKFRFGSDGSCAVGAFSVQSDGSIKSSFGANGYVTIKYNRGLQIYDPDHYSQCELFPYSSYWAYNSPGGSYSGSQTIYIAASNEGDTKDHALIKVLPYDTSMYGLYVKGKARIWDADVTSDESLKKDFQDVSTLEKLKKLRVCSWRFDEEKIVEQENLEIDEENAKIDEENKKIDAENIEIEKENELRENRKDGEPVELLPLKEHIKKTRVHKTAKKDSENALKIGCMAGEFNKAFGTNDGSEDCLSVTDTIGVCMRAIQELSAEVDDLKAKLKIQQDEKSDVELKEPTSKENLQVENADSEPSFDELLKNGENQQEEQK